MMDDGRKKCKGTRKDGKPCEKSPLIGEDFCESHHPTKILRRKLKRSLLINFFAILGLILMIAFFVWDQYLSRKSTEEIQRHMNKKEISLKEDFRQHSLAERILDSQYNPPKLTELMEEVLNLMNNDPDFGKRFYIDSRGIRVQTDNLVYGRNFIVEFNTGRAETAFKEFLGSGRKSITINENDYRFSYVLKDGEAVDSFRNETFSLVRDFPKLPLLHISTVDPTREFVCTGTLNIQVDSIAGEHMYLSNESQTIPFKIRLKYSLTTGTAEFDQLKDIFFDEKSPFYSLDQEICYYEFWLALLSNARVRIRDAVTGDSILTTEHFLPMNILPGPSFESLNSKVSILRALKKVQDLWGIVLTRSNLTKEEFQYLKGISYSFEEGSEVTKYPFRFTLPVDQAKKIIDRRKNIEEGSHTIICNENTISLLDSRLNLGRLIITLPRSHLEYAVQNDVATISVSPIEKERVVVYKFPALLEFTRPDFIHYGEFIPPHQDGSLISLVKGIEMPLESWENTKSYEEKSGSD